MRLWDYQKYNNLPKVVVLSKMLSKEHFSDYLIEYFEYENNTTTCYKVIFTIEIRILSFVQFT